MDGKKGCLVYRKCDLNLYRIYCFLLPIESGAFQVYYLFLLVPESCLLTNLRCSQLQEFWGTDPNMNPAHRELGAGIESGL